MSFIYSSDFRDYSRVMLGLGVEIWSGLHFWIKTLFQSQQNTRARNTSNSAKSGRTRERRKLLQAVRLTGVRCTRCMQQGLISRSHLDSSSAAMLRTMNWRQDSLSWSALYTVENSSSSAAFFSVTAHNTPTKSPRFALQPFGLCIVY